MILSRFTGRRCAMRAPSGAASMLVATTQNQRRQVDVAEARRGQAFGAQALKHVPQGARQRDRQADGGRRADCPPQWHPAPGEEGNTQKGAARGEQARDRADRCARRKEAKSARELARAFGSQIKQDLRGRIEHESREHQRKRSPRDYSRQERRTKRTREDAGRHCARDGPVHGRRARDAPACWKPK